VQHRAPAHTRTMGRPARRLARTPRRARPCARLGVSPGGKDPPTPLPPRLKRRRCPLPRRHVGSSVAPANGSTHCGFALLPFDRGLQPQGSSPLSQAKPDGVFPFLESVTVGVREEGKSGRSGDGGRSLAPHRCRRAAAEDRSRSVLTVKIRQPSHEFTFGVGISFIPYPLVLTPVV
jgi:hypothetical protein